MHVLSNRITFAVMLAHTVTLNKSSTGFLVFPTCQCYSFLHFYDIVAAAGCGLPTIFLMVLSGLDGCVTLTCLLCY